MGSHNLYSLFLSSGRHSARARFGDGRSGRCALRLAGERPIQFHRYSSRFCNCVCDRQTRRLQSGLLDSGKGRPGQMAEKDKGQGLSDTFADVPFANVP